MTRSGPITDPSRPAPVSPAAGLGGARGAPAVAGGHSLTLGEVTHRFGSVVAVRDVALEIKAGELVVLLGPSGCGKTTLLRIIGGFLRQAAGQVLIDGVPVDHLPPNRRNVGIVFQNYALFPHMTVAENVAYGLEARRVPRARIRERVDAMLALVRMEELGDRFPRQLSGGQQQRIALARALAVEPRLLLLDEPFGALDKNLRLDMQIEVKRLQRELNITTIMVTHDQEEALSMADRIAVMNGGRVEQFASPEDIYDRPQSLFVAGFVGTANLLKGRLSSREPGFDIELSAGGRLTLASAYPCSRSGGVVLAVRPEHLHFGAAGEGAIAAKVEMVLPLGPSVVYELQLADGTQVKLAAGRSGSEQKHAIGDSVWLRLAEGSPAAVFAA